MTKTISGSGKNLDSGKSRDDGENKHVMKKKPTNSYTTYVKRVLKKLSDKNSQISDDAAARIDFITQTMARKLSSEAREICTRNKKKTVSEAEVQLATSLYFPRMLMQTSWEQALSSIENISTLEEEGASADRKPKRRESAAGLIFPVSLTEKFLRDFGASKIHVGTNAPVALTSVLQCVVTQILTSAIEISKKYKKVTVIPRYIFLAINADENLLALVNTFNIEMGDVGVTPYIHPNFQKKSKSTKKSKSDGKGARKFRPGTVALRQIRLQQKTYKYMLQKLPLARAVREVTNEIVAERKIIEGDKKIHFGIGSFGLIQSFVEQRATTLFRSAITLAVHAKREGIQESDIMLSWELSMPKIPTGLFIDSEPMAEIGDNGIERMAKRAGVKRTGSSSYPAMRRFIHSIIYFLISKTLDIMVHRKVITINVRDIHVAIQTLGINFISSDLVKKNKVKKQA